ncbi:hypothetical protein MTO96_047999 [Rhipicephalus appendiculatus]
MTGRHFKLARRSRMHNLTTATSVGDVASACRVRDVIWTRAAAKMQAWPAVGSKYDAGACRDGRSITFVHTTHVVQGADPLDEIRKRVS